MKQIPLPQLPIPPSEYDEAYQTSLIRVLSQCLALLQVNGALNLYGIPLTGYNLQVGDVYQDGGTLKIVLAGKTYAPSLSATAKLSSVTVTH